MKYNKKVELLAPAGNQECFLAAIHAGADAVYLAGNRFGARAYADNFTEEQLIEAIRYAHLFDKKLYMTVNTLLKPDELKELVPYMIPYYEAGLDGVIVQDMGVFEVLKHHFPDLELHCSTQMTLTGPDGAAFAQRIGASRIVPARELSLSEIRQIHEAYPELELECFIHGALCYCYSGQCLFSSIVGGRSGNRGTCAQPCRLPYDVYTKEPSEHDRDTEKTLRGMALQKEKYPLSLKDLCTIKMLSELIEAGIASFKIEGRMKSAEYVAGVTGIYRAVIDRYYAAPENFDGPTQKELAVLSELYVRNETEEGYYHHYNGRHMITPDRPSYIGCSEETLAYVRTQYMQTEASLPVKMHAVLKKGQPASLYVEADHEVQGNIADYDYTRESDFNPEVQAVNIQGELVLKANSKPLTEADVRKQLGKTGGTVFCVKQIVVDMEDDIFLPVSHLNALRRSALDAFQERLLSGRQRVYQKSLQEQENIRQKCGYAKNAEVLAKGEESVDSASLCKRYTASVRTKEQLFACLESEALERIYVSDCLWEGQYGKDEAELLEHNADRLYYAFPRILRAGNRKRVSERLDILLKSNQIGGVYVATPDAYEMAYGILEASGKIPEACIIAAPFLPVMNRESAVFWKKYCHILSTPYELNEKELHELFRELEKEDVMFEMPVYGRIPLMVTANCIRKSFGQKGCSHISGISYLKDRKQNIIPVVQDCVNCCNIIYNSVPLSLHRHLAKIAQMPHVVNLFLSFTVETEEEVKKIIAGYQSCSQDMPFEEYTNGHFTRGVL